MSVVLTVNGVTYDYPQTNDVDWGPDATAWAQAISVGLLQKAGGLFQLLAEVDFGTSFGIKSLYYKTRTTNPADAGQFRLARADVISWRNQANGANLDLGVSASNVLQFNGSDIQSAISVSDTTTIDLTLASTTLSASIVALSITNAYINASAAIAYSKLNLSASIVNADIASGAAIAYSKLALTGSLVNADISASAAIAYSKLALTGSLVNADISASAAIAFSKLATLTSTNILVGSAGNVATPVAMSGDVTIGNTGVTAIGANKVSNAMLAQMATLTIKGNNTGGTANAADLTGSQATALLSNFVGDSGSGGTKGLVPAPASGDAAASKFLKADGSWAAPAGAGDVVGPASSTDSGFAKFDGTTGKLLKNSAATIVNADVSASAAIAYSKLALTGSILNADVNASAAIALSKLAATTVSRALVSDASGFVSAATTTSTEIGYVNGVTSALQTQINNKTTNLYQARAKSSNGQSIVNSASQTIIWETEDYDDGSAYNNSTGEYTCPVTGHLRVSAALLFVASTYAGGERSTLVVRIGSTTVAFISGVYSIPAGSVSVPNTGSVTIPVTAADIITVQVNNNRTAGATTLSTVAANNWVCFEYAK